MKPLLSKIVLAAVLVCLLAPPDIQAQTLTHQPTGITLPEEIAGFRRTSHQDYDAKQPGLGAGYNYYNGKGATATVYIYTAGQPNIPSGVDGALMARMREQTMREITEFARSRSETTEHLAHRRLLITTAGSDIPILFDAFTITAPTGERDTMLWLWSARGHFLKIRVTRLPKGELPPPQLDGFVEFVARSAAD